MGYWDEAYKNIQGAQTPEQLNSLQLEAPGPVDMAMGHGLRYSDLDKFKKQKLDELQQKASFPVDQKLSDFAAQGWSSDPSFTGKDWTEGLLQTTSAPGEAAPDMKNPYIAKSINDFAIQSQKEKEYADLLDNPTTAQLSRFALNKEMLPHLSALEKAPAAFIPQPVEPDLKTLEFMQKQKDTQGNREAFSNMDYLTRETTPEGVMARSSELADVTGATPEFITKEMQTPALKQFENVTEEQLTARALKGDRQAQAVLDAMQKRKLAIAKQNRAIIENSQQRTRAANLNINGLSPKENNALGIAVSEGRLDPYKINSRNQKTLASMEMNHPGIDLNSLAAEAGIARNKDIIMKAGIAEMIPDLLKRTVEAGKALKYNDAQFIGKIQKWKKGQLNDPKLTRYMTLRNDQLLTIGGVMRQNGMTDMAQRLEEEASRPTLSPRALDGWLEGQLESIDPRLNFYRSVTKGNKAIPRSGYTTGKGLAGFSQPNNQSNKPIAPAGTRVPKRGGGFYTSDGKGGWK